jgi:hypothetical protein
MTRMSVPSMHDVWANDACLITKLVQSLNLQSEDALNVAVGAAAQSEQCRLEHKCGFLERNVTLAAK